MTSRAIAPPTAGAGAVCILVGGDVGGIALNGCGRHVSVVGLAGSKGTGCGRTSFEPHRSHLVPRFIIQSARVAYHRARRRATPEGRFGGAAIAAALPAGRDPGTVPRPLCLAGARVLHGWRKHG